LLQLRQHVHRREGRYALRRLQPQALAGRRHHRLLQAALDAVRRERPAEQRRRPGDQQRPRHGRLAVHALVQRWGRPTKHLLFLVAFAATFVGAPAAAAHPYLVRAEPAPGSTLSTAPKELRLLFTERLDGPYCTVTLVGPDGKRDRAEVQVTGTSLLATVADLRPGAYRVEWSVIGDDGHRVDGEYGLGVGQGSSATASAVAGHASAQAPSGALRALLVALDVALAALVLFRSGDGNPGRTRGFIVRTVWGAAVAVAGIVVAQLWARPGAVWSTVTGRP